MKVLAICTSPRNGKNTHQLLEKALEGCQSQGAETQLYTIADKTLTPCRGCSACQIVHHCPLDDDITALLEKMKEAHVIFIGSPVFFYNVTAQCKMIIDRSYAVQPLNGNKVGGIFLTAGSMGGSSALATLNQFFTVHGITNAGFVESLGKTYRNEKAQQSAYDLGVKAVQLATALAQAPPITAHNHFAYGTHTH